MKGIIPSLNIAAKYKDQVVSSKRTCVSFGNCISESNTNITTFRSFSVLSSTSSFIIPSKSNDFRKSHISYKNPLCDTKDSRDNQWGKVLVLQAYFSTTTTTCPRRQDPPETSLIIETTSTSSHVNGEESSVSVTTAHSDTGTTTVDSTDNTKATKKEMNLFTAINDALHIAMTTNDSTIIFGQDVAFGGVFRCTQNLQSTFGKDRVFNTPLSEVGIIGMAIGYTATSYDSIAIAEIQFADYIFPALDQICNEISKFRYRSGNQWDCAGLTIRTPYGCVGHGGHYHSQSPESYLCHTPGLTVVVPRSPYTAKGLLLSSIRSPDPVIFLEPKALYRTAIEEVPVEDYELPLSQAEVIRTGSDITLIGWGQQLRMIEQACDLAKQTHNVSCEIIDVQTLVPCDYETMIRSVQKTGKCIISHEAPITLGFGAELCATIQNECFYYLQVPITRICGYDIPFPLIHEKYYVPDAYKIYDAILNCMEQAK